MLPLRLVESEDIIRRIILIHPHVIAQQLIARCQQQAIVSLGKLSPKARQNHQPLITGRSIIGYLSR